MRSIKPLDRATILASVKKTNRLVTCEDGYPQHGVGAEICAYMMESNSFFLLNSKKVVGLIIRTVPFKGCPLGISLCHILSIWKELLYLRLSILSELPRMLVSERSNISDKKIYQKNLL